MCTQSIVHTMLKNSEISRYSTPRTHPTHRTYTAQFKAELVAACQQPGVSIAALAGQHAMNTNVLQRWLCERFIRDAVRLDRCCAADHLDLLSGPIRCHPERKQHEQRALTAISQRICRSNRRCLELADGPSENGKRPTYTVLTQMLNG